MNIKDFIQNSMRSGKIIQELKDLRIEIGLRAYESDQMNVLQSIYNRVNSLITEYCNQEMILFPDNDQRMFFLFDGTQIEPTKIQIENSEKKAFEIIEYIQLANDIRRRIKILERSFIDKKISKTNSNTKRMISCFINLSPCILIELKERLINRGFISTDTTQEQIDYAFGRIEKTDSTKPIKWLKNKQLLRELVTALMHPETRKCSIAKIVPELFVSKTGEPMRLAGDKPVKSTDCDNLTEICRTIKRKKATL